MEIQKIRNHDEPSLLWKCITIAVAEFLGTSILLFLSCTGVTFGIQGAISSMHTSFAAGFAVLVVIQVTIFLTSNYAVKR